MFKQYFTKLKKFFLPVLFLLVYLSVPLYNKITESYLNNSFKHTLFTYAIIRSFNGMVSTLQESSISVGIGVDANLAIGQVLDPINDAIERFSDMITLSMWILGAEKAIYEISKLNIMYYVVFGLFFLFLFVQNQLIKKIVFFLIVIRLFLPFSALSSFYINKKFFQPQITKYQNVLISTKIENKKISTISSLKNKINFYLKNKGKIITAFINLSIIYFSKFLFNLVFLPFLFIWIIKNINLKEAL